jgi:hypothetical protein
MPVNSKKFTTPSGQTVELFYIGTLAYALGRSTNAIRKWEIAGVIPNTCFKDKFGRRMYSQEQIDAIVECAEKAQVKQGYSIANTSFKSWVHKKLDLINKNYFKVSS